MASGSPVVDNKGRAVAVNSAGSYITGLSAATVAEEPGANGNQKIVNRELPRIRTGFAYGQRVDLVMDMLEGQVQKIDWESVKPFLVD